MLQLDVQLMSHPLFVVCTAGRLTKNRPHSLFFVGNLTIKGTCECFMFCFELELEKGTTVQCPLRAEIDHRSEGYAKLCVIFECQCPTVRTSW